MATIGKVTAVNGEVIAVDDKGGKRVVHVGDVILSNETLVTARGASVDVQLNNGREIHIAGDQNVKLTDDLAETTPPDAQDNAVDANTVAAINKAIAEGRDISEVLEETAAGLGGGGGNDHGSTFENLLRIALSLNPAEYAFATASGAGLNLEPAVNLNFNPGVIGGADSTPTINNLDQNGVNPGDLLLPETAGPTLGSFSITSADGLSTLSVGGLELTAAALSALTTAPQTVITDHGVLVLTGFNPITGIVTYTYDPDVQSVNGNRIDSIPIVLKDADGDTASVSLNIVITDSAPVASNDGNLVAEDADVLTVTGNVLSNDNVGADANPNPVTPATVTLTYGNLVLNADGSYSYTLNNTLDAVNALNNGEQLSDVYTYTLTDGDGTTTTAQLTILINGNTEGAGNHAPVALDDVLSGTEGLPPSPVEGSLRDNDSDVDGDALLYSQLGDPIPGFTLNADGTYVYDFSAVDAPPVGTVVTIPYQVIDGKGGVDTAVLTITVADSAPEAIADTNAVQEDTATLATGNVIYTGTGADIRGADSVMVTAVSGTAAGIVGGETFGQYGRLALTENGNYVYELNNALPAVQALKNGQSLVDVFTYIITDSDGSTSTATLTININGSNEPLIVTSEVETTPEDTAISGNLLANDVSPDGGTLTITSYSIAGIPGTISAGTSTNIAGVGDISINADGSYIFTPVANYNGPVPAISYSMTDGSSTDSSTLNLSVTPVNDAPTASPVTLVGAEDTELTLNWGMFGVSDIDSLESALSVRIASLPADGVLMLDGVAVLENQMISKADVDAGKLVFIPDANESGSDANPVSGVGNMRQDYANFNFQVSDGELESPVATARIDINPVADGLSLQLGNAVNIQADFNQYTKNGTEQLIPDGWFTNNSGGGKFIESYDSTTYGISGPVSKVMELERHAGDASNFYTNIQTIPGQVYTLTFDFSPRAGAFGTSSQINVRWSDVSVPTQTGPVIFTTPIADASSSGWKRYTISVVGTGGLMRLEFDALDGNATTSYGGLLDNIAFTSAENTGAVGTMIKMSPIIVTLSDTDGSETSTVRITGVNEGAKITDGVNSFTAMAGSTTADITGWNLANLQYISTTAGIDTLTVTATTTEAGSGDTRTVSGNMDVIVVAQETDTAAHNLVVGSAVNDNILAAEGNDQLYGLAGNDLLNAGVGNDLLVGGLGADTLTGGAGNDTMSGGDLAVDDLTSDTFVWNLADAGTLATPAVDTINNFSTTNAASGGDVLDLRDLLTGETHDAASLDNYLHFNFTGGNTVIYVSQTGAFSDSNAAGGLPANVSSNDVQQIVLTGVNLVGSHSTDQQIIQDLLNNNKLITD